NVRPGALEIGFFLCLAVVLAWLGVGGTRLGGLLAPIVGGAAGPDAEPGLALNILVAVLLSLALWINIAVVRLLPFKAQVAVVWVELVLLFVAFIGSFNRDLGVWFETSTAGQTNLV